MADQANITRRSILQGFAVAPLIVAPPAIANAMEAAPSVASDPIFRRYVAFLAHEHRSALVAMNRELYERNADLGATPPMFWFPDDPNVTEVMKVTSGPERRARAVLHAVGLPIPPQTWF